MFYLCTSTISKTGAGIIVIGNMLQTNDFEENFHESSKRSR
jgi:hypothetical protein